ncbi:MAG: ribbon-helix-helix protein, CopG family [archaeon]|nr:ribbon-helix-helix protein, CopG family [archaeon]
MPLSKKTINKIIEKYKDVFDTLIKYDETREWPIGRRRIDITLDKETIKKLKEQKEKTGKSISQIIEKAIKNQNLPAVS